MLQGESDSALNCRTVSATSTAILVAEAVSGKAVIRAGLCSQFPLSGEFQHSEISPCSESQQSSFSLGIFQELK